MREVITLEGQAERILDQAALKFPAHWRFEIHLTRLKSATHPLDFGSLP